MPDMGFLRARPGCSAMVFGPQMAIAGAVGGVGSLRRGMPATRPRREGAAAWGPEVLFGGKAPPETAALCQGTGCPASGGRGDVCALSSAERGRRARGVNASTAGAAPHLFHENRLCERRPPSRLTLISGTFAVTNLDYKLASCPGPPPRPARWTAARNQTWRHTSARSGRKLPSAVAAAPQRFPHRPGPRAAPFFPR